MINVIKRNWKIVVILVFACILRLYRLSEVPVSLFGDELDVGYHAYSILKTGRDYQGNFMPIHFHSLAEWRTPLYLYAAVPTVAVFGISPLGVRLPAVFFGVLGVFGIYLLSKELLNFGGDSVKKQKIALISSVIMAVNPWSLQYSRAGFEVTMLLTFLIFGIYTFLKNLDYTGKYLWFSVLLLTLTPWIYSTAKLFTPILMIYLFFAWYKEIMSINKRSVTVALITALVVGTPIAYSTVFGGGAQRASYTSVFTDPTTVPEVGNDRLRDYLMRDDLIANAKPTIIDRTIHNKFTKWYEVVSNNYAQTFSADFLFARGDPNPRHSPKGVGQFYKIEFVALVAGIIYFFTSKSSTRIKFFVIFWILIGALPAELTRDGGNHATRLILILPPLIFLIAYGCLMISKVSKSLIIVLLGIWILEIGNYLHIYYVHYPWDSERWWHAGFGESIRSIKSIDNNYSKVIISMSGEPAWTFFAGWYEYSPEKWQKENPIGNDTYLNGFGKISHTDKFYFGSFNIPGKSIYDLGNYIDSKTLYMAVAKEIGANLISEPERTPSNLNLIKAIAYPSGEPAYYLFSGKN